MCGDLVVAAVVGVVAVVSTCRASDAAAASAVSAVRGLRICPLTVTSVARVVARGKRVIQIMVYGKQSREARISTEVSEVPIPMPTRSRPFHSDSLVRLRQSR